MNGQVPVLVTGVRTPIGRLGGALAAYSAVELGAAAVREVLRRCAGVRPDHIAMGNVVQAGNGQNPARIAAVRGGIDRRTPGVTLNDVCLASMSAVSMAERMIRLGEIRASLVGGFESMSRAPWALYRQRGRRRGGEDNGPDAASVPAEPVDLLDHDGLWCALDDLGMGPLSDAENVRLGIGRTAQDEFSALSHARAGRAHAARKYTDEIVSTGLGETVVDEGIRTDTSADALARLRPAFGVDGTITAGNASQMSDAGAAGLVMAQADAVSAGLRPLVAIEASAVVAGPDSGLHRMPALAAAAVLERYGIPVGEIGLWEINEAFAGVVIASMRELGLDHDRVNVNGGAVALGHPLGASGFRLVLTLAYEMRRRGVEFGVAAICGGGGQGQAILLRSL